MWSKNKPGTQSELYFTGGSFKIGSLVKAKLYNFKFNEIPNQRTKFHDNYLK